MASRSGVVSSEQFGPKYLKVWWDLACNNLGINGIGLYGGTKHTVATALGRALTPEENKKGGTGHATNKAFERYFQPQKMENLKIITAIKELKKKLVERLLNSRKRSTDRYTFW